MAQDRPEKTKKGASVRTIAFTEDGRHFFEARSKVTCLQAVVTAIGKEGDRTDSKYIGDLFVEGSDGVLKTLPSGPKVRFVAKSLWDFGGYKNFSFPDGTPAKRKQQEASASASGFSTSTSPQAAVPLGTSGAEASFASSSASTSSSSHAPRPTPVAASSSASTSSSLRAPLPTPVAASDSFALGEEQGTLSALLQAVSKLGDTLAETQREVSELGKKLEDLPLKLQHLQTVVTENQEGLSTLGDKLEVIRLKVCLSWKEHTDRQLKSKKQVDPPAPKKRKQTEEEKAAAALKREEEFRQIREKSERDRSQNADARDSRLANLVAEQKAAARSKKPKTR